MNIVDGVLVSYDAPPKNVVLSGVRVIGENALQGAAIESVVVPKGVVEIRARAFMDCTSLCKVSLPESLRKIGDFAFSSTCVDTVVLPYAVQLGEDVFFDSSLSLLVSDSRVPKFKLPLNCKIVTRAVYEALRSVGADRKYRQSDDNVRIYVRKKIDMPRVSKRQAMRKARRRKAVRLAKPKEPEQRSKRPAPTKTPPSGPRSGECTICLKPSCEHLNMSRRLGAPLMW